MPKASNKKTGKMKKAILEWLNGLRQKSGFKRFKTIAGYKKILGVDTGNEAYEIGSSLMTSEKLNGHDLTDLENFGGHLFEKYAGKTIKLIYITDGVVQFETIYAVPTDYNIFKEIFVFI